MALLPHPPILTFIHMEGCSACEKMKPEFEQLKTLLRDVAPTMRYRDVDLTKKQVAIVVAATPAFHLEFNDRGYGIDALQLIEKGKQDLNAEGVAWWVRACFSHYREWKANTR